MCNKNQSILTMCSRISARLDKLSIGKSDGNEIVTSLAYITGLSPHISRDHVCVLVRSGVRPDGVRPPRRRSYAPAAFVRSGGVPPSCRQRSSLPAAFVPAGSVRRHVGFRPPFGVRPW